MGKLKTHENEEKEKDSGISEDDDDVKALKGGTSENCS